LKEKENKNKRRIRNIQGEGTAGGCIEVKKSIKRTTSLCRSILLYKNCILSNDIE
jgi:hypothetical protein